MARLSGKIAKHYAKALFDLSDQDTMEARRNALREFAETWDENTSLRETLTNPSIPLPERMHVIKDLSAHLRADDETFTHFLCLLLDNGRLSGASEIAEVLTRLINSFKKQLSLVVTSAHALPEADKSAIQERARGDYGSLVSIDWEVNPDIIGGLIIQSGDKVLDTSVKGSLAQIKQQLRAS